LVGFEVYRSEYSEISFAQKSIMECVPRNGSLHCSVIVTPFKA
jgi:hypothetical protein